MAVPFWLFRDASFGTLKERRANYRYNRTRRHLLPFFLLKWIGMAFCLLQAMTPLTQIMGALPSGSTSHFLSSLLCMFNGIALAFACAVITILGASYLYLCVVED